MRTTDDLNEIFDIVDTTDTVIGRATRKECNSDPVLIHRAAFVLIFNDTDQLLWQKRSLTKDVNPGAWITSASGHVNSGESYEQTAIREVKEELGVDITVEFLGKFLYRYKNESEFSAIFKAHSNGPFDFDPNEISEVRFLSLRDFLKSESEGTLEVSSAVHNIVDSLFTPSTTCPNIRAFDPDDWPDVCQVYSLAALQELEISGANPKAFRPMSEEEDLEKFLARNTSLVACLENRIVGFVAWREGGFLPWLYVDPKHQGQGVGTQLLRDAMDSIGPEAWTLAKAGNNPAISLYLKHGMEIVMTRDAENWGFSHPEHRLALPTSRKHDPSVPSFGE